MQIWKSWFELTGIKKPPGIGGKVETRHALSLCNQIILLVVASDFPMAPIVAAEPEHCSDRLQKVQK